MQWFLPKAFHWEFIFRCGICILPLWFEIDKFCIQLCTANSTKLNLTQNVACVLEYLRYLHQLNFMEICLSGSDWSSQFLRQFQLWYAKPGLSCRLNCRIGCRISNTRVFKLPDFVLWPHITGDNQDVRQVDSSPCDSFLAQDWSYARWPWYSFSATELNSGYSALHMALTPIGNRPWSQVLHIIKES